MPSRLLKRTLHLHRKKRCHVPPTVAVGSADSKTLSERKKLKTDRSFGCCGKRSILAEFDKNKSGGSVPTESLVEPNDKTQPSLCVVHPAQVGCL